MLNKIQVGPYIILVASAAFLAVSCSKPKPEDDAQAITIIKTEDETPQMSPSEVVKSAPRYLDTPQIIPIDGDYNTAVANYDSGAYGRALPVLAKFTQVNDAGACLRLGVAYLQGHGIDANRDAAISFLNCAKRAGENSANIWLGVAYSDNDRPKLDLAIQAYEESITQAPNATALLGLREIYLRPDPNVRDHSLSARYAVRGHILSDVKQSNIIKDLITYYNCETLLDASTREGARRFYGCEQDRTEDRIPHAQNLFEAVSKQSNQSNFYSVLSQ